MREVSRAIDRIGRSTRAHRQARTHAREAARAHRCRTGHPQRSWSHRLRTTMWNSARPGKSRGSQSRIRTGWRYGRLRLLGCDPRKGQRAVLKPAAGPGTTLWSQPPEPKPPASAWSAASWSQPAASRPCSGSRLATAPRNSAAKKSGASPKKSPHARESPARRGNGYRASLAGEALKPVTPCQPPRRGCTDPFGPSTLRPCNAPCLTVGFRPAVGLPCRGPPDAAGGVPITVSESDTGTAKGYPGR